MFYPQFKLDPKIQNAAAEVMKKIAPRLQEIDEITEYNQQKMMAAFHEAGVSESHFVSSTGYGYGDRGRDALDMVYAKALGAEDALVRHNFVSGTHALTVALFGVLRPGDTMLSVTGIPYDTLRGVIGITGDSNGSLKEFGIHYKEVQPGGTITVLYAYELDDTTSPVDFIIKSILHENSGKVEKIFTLSDIQS